MRTPDQNPPSEPSDAPDPPVDADPTPPSPEEPRLVSAGRPRVIAAEVHRDRGWEAVIRVVLERDGVRASSEREAVGEEAVVLRCAAEATLDALRDLLGGPPRFALIGAKRMLAFDAAVLLACVRTLEGPPRKLIGCVPIQDESVDAVARAVLHATNRIVEALPNAEPSPDEDGDPDES